MIETERLRLVPLTLATAAAIVNGSRPASARWAAGYPLDGTLVAASLLITAEGEGRGALGPFSSFQIVLRNGTVIGDCGFFRSPEEVGVVHIGCDLCAGERGRGYATEALGALLAWERAQPGAGARRVVAEATTPQGERLLERVGMHQTGRHERLVYFGN